MKKHFLWVFTLFQVAYIGLGKTISLDAPPDYSNQGLEFNIESWCRQVDQLKPGDDVRLEGKQYRIVRITGIGSQGKTFKAVESGNTVLLKLGRTRDAALNREKLAFDKLDKGGISDVNVFLAPELGMYIVRTYIEGDNLLDVLTRGDLSSEQREQLNQWFAKLVDLFNRARLLPTDMHASNFVVSWNEKKVVLVDPDEIQSGSGLLRLSLKDVERDVADTFEDDIYLHICGSDF